MTAAIALQLDTRMTTIPEACARLGCRRTKIFALLREKRLRRVDGHGRETLLTTESVEAELARMVTPRHRALRPVASRGLGGDVRGTIDRLRDQIRSEDPGTQPVRNPVSDRARSRTGANDAE